MESFVSDTQLKNRIFGAILLVILAVLLIPLFLGEPRSNIKIPQQEEKKQFQSKIQPLPEIEEDIDQSVLEEKEENSSTTGLVLKRFDTDLEVKNTKKTLLAPTESQKAVDAATQEVVEDKLESTEKPKPKEEKEDVVTQQEWALQAGIFSKKENADSIVKILSKHGFEPVVSSTEVNFGKATRVWLGPFDTKEQAEEKSAKLKSIIGSGGYIAPYPFK